ncbi:phospholipase D family protein [Ktedonospora formicarum]|uniref:Phospholipase n=1 Tax=Ktedonospora formicarum TaxID=2778364 RepID=A0A8J3HUA7_9CHLR|nr:phospholipase D family protein [Ktedonospora formicarum]GHO44132.1 phospholipase [Ktedonospora formicarum]
MDTLEASLQVERDASPQPEWTTSDFPIRSAFRSSFLIDGRMTMLEMCIHFLRAKQSILIAAWGLTPELAMVRGKHHRAGADGSPEQEELLRWLHKKGLSEADIAFWQDCDSLDVTNVLGYVASKGVDVRILLWDFFSAPFQKGSQQIKEELEAQGILCLTDNGDRDLLNHPIQSLHQKTMVIDNRYAFVGGIDLMTEKGGDFDRWDTKGHIYYNVLRLGLNDQMPHSWHDVHFHFEGTAVADVARNFCQRWNSVVARQQLDEGLLLPEPSDNIRPIDEHEHETIPLQIVRTIPPQTYEFAPNGIKTILEIYLELFRHAQRFIYIENQYLWRRTFLGLENPAFGPPHEDMERLCKVLAEALERGVHVILVLPDHPNVGRDFTDDGLLYLQELAPEAVASGRLQVYTLATHLQQGDQCFYRPIYVHAKVAIVDDEWVTIGSANINDRGMRNDAELNVALVHKPIAHALRILLTAEHLGLVDEDTLFSMIEIMGRLEPSDELLRVQGELGALWSSIKALLADHNSAMAACATQARANLEAIKSGQILTGHLVPYIREDLADEYELTVDAVKGWIGQFAQEQSPLLN